jgi:hypothetical protein
MEFRELVEVREMLKTGRNEVAGDRKYSGSLKRFEGRLE